jgi:chromate reductase
LADVIKVLGISGSLRDNSYNTALLEATADMFPPNMKMQIADIGSLPLYDPDMKPYPPLVVEDFIDEIEEADAIIFATPEYNHSVSGALKNAIDWASRTFGRAKSVLDGKPAGIVGVATGGYGTVRGQQHLRDILFAVNMHVLQRPMILVPFAKDKFDDDLRLIDEQTRIFLREFIDNFHEWIQKFRQPG